MILDIDVRLDYALAAPSDLLLQIEAAPTPEQLIQRAWIDTGQPEHFFRITGEDGIGERVWLRTGTQFLCHYTSRIEVTRPQPDLAALAQVPLHQLPSEVVKYLMASRFCASDELQSFVAAEFGRSEGGRRITEIRDWIGRHISYVSGTSWPWTTATDTFVQRQGICRDFAHLMVALARASAIPARVASVYSPDIDPPDFHAVAEVYLDGAWHLVDATGMATPDRMAVVGVGRDAADIAFMTLYGVATLNAQSVSVTAG